MPASKSKPALTPAKILAATNFAQVCERIEAGQTQRELAKSLKVSVASLSNWLNRDDHRERYRSALLASAESWLDKGLEAVQMSLRKKGAIDPQAARAYAQECARRAALRNPRYVEKTAHEHTGPGGGPVQFQKIERVIVDPAHRDPAGIRPAA